MIVITGATGALNGATAAHLLDRVPAAEVVVVARDVAKAQRFADRGVTVRHGDYADPATLPAAFAGAAQVLLVSSSDPGADAVALHRTAIDAAVAAGAGRILYTSHQGAHPGTPFRPGRHHAATEELLAASGVAWTSLRNGFYAHSLAWLGGPWRETGIMTVPADGPVSWTSRDDAAEAAALILAAHHTPAAAVGGSPDGAEGPTPDGGARRASRDAADAAGGAFDGPVTLTAGAAPTFAELAEIASRRSGRTVAVEVVDAEHWVAAQVAGGSPEGMARFLLGMYQAAEQGYFAGVDPLLGKLLGREPHTAEQALFA